MLMRLGEPGVIVSDLCHKRNIFPPTCAHPAPLLEDLLDCKVLMTKLSLFLFCFFCSSCSSTGRSFWLQGTFGRTFTFQTINSDTRYFIQFFVLSSQSLLLDQCVRIFSFTISFTFFFRDFWWYHQHCFFWYYHQYCFLILSSVLVFLYYHQYCFFDTIISTVFWYYHQYCFFFKHAACITDYDFVLELQPRGRSRK